MQATDLSHDVWNAIADLIGRSGASRQVYFVKVTKADTAKLLVWTEEFGDTAIPLVAPTFKFAYFDTLQDGSKQKMEDVTEKNDIYQTHIICPKSGDDVVVIDADGSRRFPFCIGVIQSKSGYWEGT